MNLEKLTASIQAHEGTGPVKNGMFLPYKDSLGNETIAFGHLIADGVSNAAGMQILSDDIQFAIGEAQSAPWWQYVAGNDARENALTEIVFNIGIAGVSEFHDALAAMAIGDWNACGAAFLDSLWHKQTGQRAEVLATMIITGEFSN